MTFKILGGARQPIKLWVDDLGNVESGALDQLRDTANLPWVRGVAGMPDVHFGKGATVGSVILNDGAISPAITGVDIGCGMIAVKTPFKSGPRTDKSDNLGDLRGALEKQIPVGYAANDRVSPRVKKAHAELGSITPFALQKFEEKKKKDKSLEQMGSLGGGNHFIELCLDKDGEVWVMLHSGSRNIGKELAELHMDNAVGLMAETVRQYGVVSIPKDLAPLLVGTDGYKNYVHDLNWAQAYAKANRDEMMVRALAVLSKHVLGEDIGAKDMTTFRVDCHHNYVEAVEIDGMHYLLTRKGAVSAKAGEFGIIPGSMGAKSFIVRGKGNPDSYCSCSHGAGRVMSRGAAKRTFNLEDLEAQTQGVECRKDLGVLDEIPGAYKNIDQVMANQADLVEPVFELKQFLCMKG